LISRGLPAQAEKSLSLFKIREDKCEN